MVLIMTLALGVLTIRDQTAQVTIRHTFLKVVISGLAGRR